MLEILYDVVIECGKDVIKADGCNYKHIINLLDMLPNLVVQRISFYQPEMPTITIRVHTGEEDVKGE